MALPSGRLLRPTIDLRASLPPAMRVGRVLTAAGEMLAAVTIIGGGCVLTGLATLL